jgi:hypothetical protein
MPGTIVELWQPNWVNLPELVQDQPTDWDDGGTAGLKFVQGVIIEADSLNVSKAFQIQSSDDLSVHTPLEAPATWNGQSTISFSFATPFLTHAMRVISTDGISWRRWKVSYVFIPYPESNNNWQTEKISFGLKGWGHIPWVNLCHQSSTDLALTLTPDNGPPVTVTVPNSGSVQKKTLAILPANKFKVASLDVLAGTGASNPSVIELRAIVPSSGYGLETSYPVYFDKDGTTAWQFQDPLGVDFAHNLLADGSIIRSGFIGIGSIDADFSFTTSMWLQDDSTPAHYFILSNGHLYKLHVSGASFAVDANLTITGTQSYDYWCQGVSGGVRYIIILNHISNTLVRIFAVNADTMTIIGHYDHTPINPNMGQPFMDASGVFWSVMSGIPNGADLISWNPPDGASGGILNVTTHNVTAATLGTTNVVVCATYSPANNSAIIGTHGTGFNQLTGDLIVVSLTSFTVLASHLDDGLFFYVGAGPTAFNPAMDGAISAFENGIVNGKLAIEQDVSSHATQFGGIVTLIDPVTLVPGFSFNATSLIHAAHLAHPAQVPDDVPFASGSVFSQIGNMRYSAANGGSFLITFDGNSSLGSQAYYVTNALPAAGNPFRIFEKDCEVAVGQWNRSGGYQIVKPFGGPNGPGAKV